MLPVFFTSPLDGKAVPCSEGWPSGDGRRPHTPYSSLPSAKQAEVLYRAALSQSGRLLLGVAAYAAGPLVPRVHRINVDFLSCHPGQGHKAAYRDDDTLWIPASQFLLQGWVGLVE